MNYNILFSMNLMIFFLLLIILYLFSNSFFMILISMEFMLVFILMLLTMNLTFDNNDWLFMYMLVMGVCESVIGISLMISLVYDEGNESMKVLNLVW